MKYRLAKIFFILVVLIVAGLLTAFYRIVYAPSRFTLGVNATSSTVVQLLARKVLMEKLLGEIGSPPDGDTRWLQVFVDGRSEVLTWPEKDRLDYYTIIILNFDLDTEAAYTFAEDAQKVALPLSSGLALLLQSDQLPKFTKAQRERVRYWREKLLDIYKLGGV